MTDPFDSGEHPVSTHVELDPGQEDAWRSGEPVRGTAFYKWPDDTVTSERITTFRAVPRTDDE